MAYRGMSCVLRSVCSTINRRHTRDFLHNTARISSPALRRQYTNSTDNKHEILSRQMTLNSVRTNQTWRDKKPAVVIFDKDGTLICFHTMWFPWLQKISNKLCKITGLNIEDKIYDLLGYCTSSQKFIPGLLAQSTKPIILKELTKLLIEEGFDETKAAALVKDVYEEGDSDTNNTLKALANTRTLFKILKSHDVKIAVSTSDSREGTLITLKKLGIEEFVDLVVCGDDPDIEPKPSPYSAFKICSQLGVDPSDAVMVGDTKADVGMGKAANIGWNIGVLSGVGNSHDLLPEADHVIHSVTDLLPLILPGKEWHQYYKYKASERVMVEPYHLEDDVHSTTQTAVVKDGVDLVIFDLHGTLLCTQNRYVKWLDTLCTRIDQMTGLMLTPLIHRELGVCSENKKLEQGLLSDGTVSQVKCEIADILLDNGLGYEESILVVNQAWNECSYLLEQNTKSSDIEAKKIFKTLKQNGTKIAICTCDSRDSAVSDLDTLGLLKYVDMMVCGDDPHSESKPLVNSVSLICNEFKVDPKNAVVIGDTMKDIKEASAANIFRTIGVLSGLGDKDSLQKHADYVVQKVGDVAQHLFDPLKKVQVRSYSTVSQSVFSATSSVQKRSFSTSSVRTSTPSYDYVIVGGGSAGCTLANRLTESGEDKVLLMEAGPKDNTWKIWMPAALMYNLCDDKYNWFYHTEPEAHMNNRVMYWPRGRTLGGSSALNAMVYIRGHAFDYDRWEKEGATDWSYASCLPYFKKAQSHELGENEYRGGSGPLHVSRGITNNPLHSAFIEAGQQAGYPFTDDMNGYQQEGVGWMDMTIHKGWRWSAAEAYLHPVKSRSNLETKVKVLTTKILFDQNRAVGIEYTEKNGEMKKVMANKEVILSGGAINSPQLLMLSGVGNADELRSLDIPVVAHLPGVGENLQDHLEMYIQQKCTKPITLYSAQWKFPHNMVKIGLQWGLTRTGWGATTHLESGGFIRSRPGVEHPDLQFHFLPSVVKDHGRKTGDCHAYQLHIGSLRPTSKGYLKLKSRNPKEHPKIVANYLSTEGDMQEFRDSLRLTREIFAQKAFSEFCGGELQPGADVQTPKQIDEFIRNVSDSAYHPSCTNKMGQPSDPMAVVDPETRVIGLEGLRVVDASIMPSVVSGNLNGPTIMIAEKAADIIRGISPLPKSNAPVYRPKTLDTQR